MNAVRIPAHYKPTAIDLLWLVSESPRCGLFLEEFREGRATARELCAVIWPEVNPDVPDVWLSKLSPVQYITEVLDHEATPCSFGGAGRCLRRGDDYLVQATIQTGRQRPYGLPVWPKN